MGCWVMPVGRETGSKGSCCVIGSHPAVTWLREVWVRVYQKVTIVGNIARTRDRRVIVVAGPHIRIKSCQQGSGLWKCECPVSRHQDPLIIGDRPSFLGTSNVGFQYWDLCRPAA